MVLLAALGLLAPPTGLDDDLSVSTSVTTPTGAAWVEVPAGSATGGGISGTASPSRAPSIAAAPDGTLFVAWETEIQPRAHFEIYARRFSGTSWEEIGTGSASGGGVSQTTGASRSPVIAAAPDGTIYVAWHDDSSGNSEIYLRQFDGNRWREAGAGSSDGGGISGMPSSSRFPALAVGSDGAVYVAWEDVELREIFVRRFYGTHWEQVGASSATGGGVSQTGTAQRPALAIGPEASPYVAWLNEVGDDLEVYVRRFNGTAWEEVGKGSASGGGVSQNGESSTGPWPISLAVTRHGNVYVAWSQFINNREQIYVRGFDGERWVDVGTGSSGGNSIISLHAPTFASSPFIAVPADGTPHLAYQASPDADILDAGGRLFPHVSRFDGTNWIGVGQDSETGSISRDAGLEQPLPTVALDPTGKIHVAWSDSTDVPQIFVLREP